MSIVQSAVTGSAGTETGLDGVELVDDGDERRREEDDEADDEADDEDKLEDEEEEVVEEEAVEEAAAAVEEAARRTGRRADAGPAGRCSWKLPRATSSARVRRPAI